MIQIEDNDLPITVAQKIVSGLKPATPTQNVMCKVILGKDHEGQDMFNLDEIKEIADYLTVYYESHKRGD